MKNLEIYELEHHSDFDKGFKRLVKKKKFLKLPTQIEELTDELIKGEFSGDVLKRSTEPCYEIYKKRLANPSGNESQQDGFRVVYFAQHDDKIIVLITIYHKADQETVSDTYIEGWLDSYFAYKAEDEE